jgi:hypothetical protein
MSDQVPGTPPAQSKEVPIENVKAEFERKTTQLSSQVQELAKTNATLMKQLQALQSPAAPKPVEKPIEDLIYDDPKQAVEKITQTVRATIRKELDDERQGQAAQTSAINELYVHFPEFADNEHPLTKKALEKYGAMDPKEKADPKALKVAAYEAALELDVKPRGNRGDDDSFSMGGSSFSSGARPTRGKSDKLDPAVLETAALFGLDTSKQEVVDRLKGRAQRTDYKRYQSGNK